MTKKQQLRKNINEHFSLNEIRILCFDLDIDIEDLPGESKSDKIVGLINYLERHGNIKKLLKYCQINRPNINWIADELAGMVTSDHTAKLKKDDTQETKYDIEQVKARFVVKGFEYYENFVSQQHKFQLIATKRNYVVMVSEFTNLDGMTDDFVARAFVQSCGSYVSSKFNKDIVVCLPCMITNSTDPKAINRLRGIVSDEAEAIEGRSSKVGSLINRLNPFFKKNIFIHPVVYSTRNPGPLVTTGNLDVGWIISGENWETAFNKLVRERN